MTTELLELLGRLIENANARQTRQQKQGRSMAPTHLKMATDCLARSSTPEWYRPSKEESAAET